MDGSEEVPDDPDDEDAQAERALMEQYSNLIIRYDFDDQGRFNLWYMDASTVRKAVEDGRLQGVIEGDTKWPNAYLTNSGDELAAFIQGTAGKDLFPEDNHAGPLYPLAPTEDAIR